MGKTVHGRIVIPKHEEFEKEYSQGHIHVG